MVPPRRPGLVTAAGVILIVIGSLGMLLVLGFALIIVLLLTVASNLDAGASAPRGSQAADPAAALGVLVVIGVVWTVWTVAHLVAGIGILNRRGWSRVLGIVLASIGELLTLLVIGLLVVFAIVAPDAIVNDANRSFSSGTSAEATAQFARFGLLVDLVFLIPFAVGYGLTAFALLRRAAWFDLPLVPAVVGTRQFVSAGPPPAWAPGAPPVWPGAPPPWPGAPPPWPGPAATPGTGAG
ncbi:MAG: hypothetical protein M3295_04235, partial [Chloroflexota bacterium]|nr:hypothetical protein [Chloroflexota bacterium]